MTPYYSDDYATIYHGDCREILPYVGPVDLVLTDPPYGINADGYRAGLPNTKGLVMVSPIAGDGDTSLAEWLFSWIGDTPAVIWGSQNWPHLLPHKGRWCCWDKRCGEKADKMLGSAFELAWENRKSGFNTMVRVLHGGVVNADGGKRVHPTQKPVKLFSAILVRYEGAGTILDPFVGSGTTLVAAKNLGRKSIGIEIEERYCEIAVERLSQEVLDLATVAHPAARV